jgi:predicted RNA-binding protein with TRAM domain
MVESSNMAVKKISTSRFVIFTWLVIAVVGSVGYASVSMQSANAAATTAEVLKVDFTSGTKVGNTITNDAVGKLADLTVNGSPTGFGAADGLSFPNTVGGSTNNYLTGNLGNTTYMTKLELQMVAKFPDNGCVAQNNGSMVFGLGKSGSYSKYNIYRHSNFIGFDTFNSELYGVALPDNTDFHTYKFVMVNKDSANTLQEIWINGVKQTLSYKTTSTAVGNCATLSGTGEVLSARVFAGTGTTGAYSDGSFTLMTHPIAAGTWGTTGSIRSLNVTTTNVYVVPGAPTIGTIVSGDKQLSVPFTAPTSNGGRTITDYQYSIDAGVNWISAGTTSPLVITGLTNGTAYTVQLRAVNAEGAGTAASRAATPFTVPGAPTITSISPNSTQLLVYFTAPANNGGSAITTYRYSTDGGATFTTRANGGVNSPVVISGLVNGTSYDVQIQAVNAAGAGAASATFVGVPNPIAPGAPTIGTVVLGDKQLTVPFTAPGSNGGSPITGYEYSIDSKATWVSVGTSSPIVISGLTNGTSYDVWLRAVNSVGPGTTAVRSSVIPRTVPGAPTINSLTPASGQLSVNFSAPTDNGGSTVTNYKYSIDGGVTFLTRSPLSNNSPLVITGLTNGTSYEIKIQAINVAGTGAASDVKTAIAGVVPGVPTINSIVGGNGQLSVNFTAPASAGTLPITHYKYSTDNGVTYKSAGSTANPIVITGLTNGTNYSVRIRAVSAVGDGTETSFTTGKPITTASAPTITSITPSNGQLSVAFTAPTSNGGSSISNYKYSLDGGATYVAPVYTVVTPLVITGLTNGRTYDLRLLAVTAAGDGTPTEIVQAAPAGPPGTPTITSITPGNGQLTVAFTPPTSNGGSAITGYKYSSDGGATFTNAGLTAGPIVITGLTNGTTYLVRLIAVNAIGDGFNATFAGVKPFTTADAPTINSITGSAGQISIDFTAPSNNGGSAITTYKYSLDGGATFATRIIGTTLSPWVIRSLTNGQTYDVRILAVNAAGDGTPSATTQGTPVAPATVAGAPTINSVNYGDSQLSVDFTAPASNGGSVITGYKYSTNNGTSYTSTTTISSPLVITGLTNGTAYTIKLIAVNAVGDSVASNAVAGTPKTVPTAPTVSSVTAGNGTLTVGFAAASNRGSAITNYKYSLDDGATWILANPVRTISPLTITGLTNGTAYQVKLLAVNAIGDGIQSNMLPGTPVSAPSAPTITSITNAVGRFTIAFQAPVTDGGSPVTGYKYSIDNGSTWLNVTGLTGPIEVTGLTRKEYLVKMMAVNAIGSSPASTFAVGYPAAIAFAPIINSIVPDDQSLTIDFRAPTNDGGTPIVKYQYTLNAGVSWTDSALGVTNISLTSLTNGDSYTVAVRAVTDAGLAFGQSSPPVTVVIGGLPAAPTINSLVESNGKLTINFTAPTVVAGQEIIDYKYSIDGGTNWISTGSTATSIVVTGLTNGTTYDVQLRAISAKGDGFATQTTPGTPYTVPNAPTIDSVVSENTQLTVYFKAPAFNGGSSITAYKYSIDGGTTWSQEVSTASPMVITGLTNGTTYNVRILAVNPAGTSEASTAASGKPVGPSSAPAITAVKSENSKLTISFTAPTNDGGSVVTGYKYSIDGGDTWTSLAGTASPFVVIGLTNGTSYDLALVAVNSAGDSVSSSIVVGIPQLTIGTPGLTTVVIGNGKVTVTPSKGATGDAPASYLVTATPGGASCTVTAPATSCEITGLTNGSAYTFTTTATNAGGTSQSTAPTASATPVGPSSVPAIGAVVSANSKLTVSFTAPTNNGGAAVTGYKYSLDAGSTWVSVASTSSPIVITGLTNGTSYSLRLKAVNAGGESEPSAIVAAVPQLTIGLPGPTTVEVGDERVTVTPSRGATGDAPASYTITASPGGASCTVVAPATNCVITGLVNGEAYTFTTTATNAGGTSGSTLPTPSVIPFIPIPVDGDGNLPPKKISSTGKFTATNDSSFQVAWTKTSGKLVAQATGVFIGYIEGKITFVRGGVTHTCTTQFGQIKAMPYKTAKDRAAAGKMKTFVGKQFCTDRTKLDPKTIYPKGGMTTANFKKIKPMNKSSVEQTREKAALAALKSFQGPVEIEIVRYRASAATMTNVDARGAIIKQTARKTKVSL